MPPRSTRRPSAGSMRNTLSCRARRSVATAMSAARPPSCTPYSTSMLFGRSIPEIDLADLTVHAEHHDGAGRRGDLHRAEDQAARRILRVHPDSRIVGIVGELSRGVLGFDFERLRQRRRAAEALSNPRPVPASCAGIRTRRTRTTSAVTANRQRKRSAHRDHSEPELQSELDHARAAARARDLAEV